MNNMIERLESMERRYEELNQMLMDPSIGEDIKKMTEVTKEQASLQAARSLPCGIVAPSCQIAGSPFSHPHDICVEAFPNMPYCHPDQVQPVPTRNPPRTASQ